MLQSYFINVGELFMLSYPFRYQLAICPAMLPWLKLKCCIENSISGYQTSNLCMSHQKRLAKITSISIVSNFS